MATKIKQTKGNGNGVDQDTATTVASPVPTAKVLLDVPLADLELLRLVAVRRASRNGGRVNVGKVILALVKAARIDLKGEANGTVTGTPSIDGPRANTEFVAVA